MKKTFISTPLAPQAIGTYSQAVKVGHTLYISGQIPLDPNTMEIEAGDIGRQIHRVFRNLQAIVEAGGGSFADIVKLNVFLTDLGNFPVVNQIMAEYFTPPYPARAVVGVSALPKGVGVEIDAIMNIDPD